MYNRISNFIHKHSLLNEYQFGFRQKRSTNQAIKVLLDKITAALDNGDIVLGVFLDFSKARFTRPTLSAVTASAVNGR